MKNPFKREVKQAEYVPALVKAGVYHEVKITPQGREASLQVYGEDGQQKLLVYQAYDENGGYQFRAENDRVNLEEQAGYDPQQRYVRVSTKRTRT